MEVLFPRIDERKLSQPNERQDSIEIHPKFWLLAPSKTTYQRSMLEAPML